MKKLLLLAVLISGISTGCNRQESTLPTRRNIVDAVFASGNVLTENQYIVTPQAEGYLSQIFFREGDSVKAGQVLFTIENIAQPEQLVNAETNYEYALSNARANSPVLNQLLAQKKQIENKLKTDSLNFVRHQKLVKSGAVSQVDYEKAKVSYENSLQDLISVNNEISDTKNKLDLEVSKNRANLATQQNTSSYYKIVAASDGVIFEIQKQRGELVKRGEPLAEIGSGKYIAKLFIAEEDINKLKLGQEVFIELNAERGKSYRANISKVYPYFDSKEQSFLAEATFAESTALLKSGTQLQANIKTSEKNNAIVIPSEYLLPGDFILDKNQDQVKVTVGIRSNEWVEIISGLDESSIIYYPR